MPLPTRPLGVALAALALSGCGSSAPAAAPGAAPVPSATVPSATPTAATPTAATPTADPVAEAERQLAFEQAQRLAEQRAAERQAAIDEPAVLPDVADLRVTVHVIDRTCAADRCTVHYEVQPDYVGRKELQGKYLVHYELRGAQLTSASEWRGDGDAFTVHTGESTITRTGRVSLTAEIVSVTKGW